MEYKFSVIIPVYNTEAFIERCIDSVINQAGDDTEIVVIDDGSTDNSKSRIEPYVNRYKFVRYFYQKNQGPSVARNSGIVNSNGTYVILLDSDDRLCNGTIDNLRKIAEKKPDAILCRISTCDFTTDEYTECEWQYPKTLISGESNSQDDVIRMLLRNRKYWYATPGLVVRRKFLTENMIFFEKGIYHEDELWTMQVLTKALSFKACSKEHYICTSFRSGSRENTPDIKKEFDKLFIIKKVNELKSKSNSKYVIRLCNKRSLLLLCSIYNNMSLYQNNDQIGVLRKSYNQMKRHTYGIFSPAISLIFLLRNVVKRFNTGI